MLSHSQAKQFYDRFGSLQDLQRLYEDPAIEVLEAHADFGHAHALVEFGCGTGRLARHLLEGPLGPAANYMGLDISTTMVALTQERLAPFADRAEVRQTLGEPVVPVSNGACDRFLCTYVLDLLTPADTIAVIAEAQRILAPGGRMCLASLTFGEGPFSRAIDRLWTTLHARRPDWVGGCHPIRLGDLLDDRWRILHREVVCTFGLCTEVVVARPGASSAPTSPRPPATEA